MKATDLPDTERDRPLMFHWKPEIDFADLLPFLRTIGPSGKVALNSILAEAVLAFDTGQWVSYSRTKAFYAGLRRYGGTAYTYTSVLSAIDAALAHGMIEEDRALPGRRGWQSRFRATARLLDLWQDGKAVFDRPEVIELKNAAGERIDYKDTDRTRSMRRELQNRNEYLRSIRFDINAPDAKRTAYHVELDGAFYLPTLPELYRVFNRGSWSKGGRAYGWWQSLKKRRRAAALINDEPVSEPDFESMHAAILYAGLGRSLDFDPYETGSFHRDAGKIAFMIGINATSNVGAINAIARKLGREKGYAAAVYDAVRRLNKPLDNAGFFGSDTGAGLMFEDSKITLGTLKDCQRAGIAALPIHDSMLTPARHAHAVAGLMRENFSRRFEGSIHCTVRVSAETVLHMPSPSSFPVFSSSWGGCLEQASLQDGIATIDHRRPGDLLQLSFFHLFDVPGERPEHEVVAEALAFDGGRLSEAVVRLIRDRRRATGERQEDTARRLGISRPQLANAERQRFGLGREPAARLKLWLVKAAKF